MRIVLYIFSFLLLFQTAFSQKQKVIVLNADCAIHPACADYIHSGIEKAKEDLQEIRDRKLKYPKEAGQASSGDEFITESEYKKGGLVKKGLPKLAKKGWK